MNLWQMSSRAPLKPWPRGGGVTQDQGDMRNGIPVKNHYSIHRMGRSDVHRAKQKAKRRSLHG